MVDIPALNWFVISLEILIAIVWISVFLIELFPIFRFRRIKYKLDTNHQFFLKKTLSNDFKQGSKTIFNLLLLGIVIILTYLLSDQPVPYFDHLLGPVVKFLPSVDYFIALGLLIVLVPRRIFAYVLPYYLIRQLKYFALMALIYLPLFLADASWLSSLPVFQSLDTSILTWVTLLLPTQLLVENGISLSLADKANLFLLLFVLVPLTISLCYQIFPGLLGRIQKYSIYEWRNGKWEDLDTTVYENDDDTAVLLLHGLNSTKEMWSSYTGELGSVRIMDHIDMNTDDRYLRTKIFAIDFSDRLKQSFKSRYSVKSTSFEGSASSVQLNNYVWELLYTIFLLKNVKEIERIHIVAHSSGGVILRQFLNEVHNNPKLQSLRSVIGYNEEQQTITAIDKISWLAVPHFGAKGGSAMFLSLRKTFPFNLLLHGLSIIPALDKFGGMLLGVGLNAPGALDLDPFASFIKQLNSPKNTVQLYAGYEYKNAYAVADQVVGSGAQIKDRSSKLVTGVVFVEKAFNADHSNAPWEQLSQIPGDKLHDYPPIHHSLDVIEWILVND